MTDKNKCSLCCQGGERRVYNGNGDLVECGTIVEQPSEARLPKHTQEYEYMETLIAEMAVALEEVLGHWHPGRYSDWTSAQLGERTNIQRLIDDADALLELGREKE